MLQPKIWQQLEVCESILLSGCGGGYDVYQALPLYFTLRAMGKKVSLANLTFSNTSALTNVNRPIVGLHEITGSTGFSGDYCPEAHLVHYLKNRHAIQETIHTIDNEGYAVVANAYQYLADSLHLDAILLVDGGSDSLMAGDEENLATIEEDHTSIIAVHDVCRDMKLRSLVVLGLGVDRHHGCSDAASMRAVAELTKAGGLLGMQMLQPDMIPVQHYKEAVNYANAHCRDGHNGVGAFTVASIEGRYGNYHSNQDTPNSSLYINPMMGMMWFFEIAHVQERWLTGLRKTFRATRSRSDVVTAVKSFRAKLKERSAIRKVEEFPRSHVEEIPDDRVDDSADWAGFWCVTRDGTSRIVT